jgi:hypothetical protein
MERRALIRCVDGVADSEAKEFAERSLEACIRLGMAVTRRPLLLAINRMPGGVPLGPSSEQAMHFAHSYLTEDQAKDG